MDVKKLATIPPGGGWAVHGRGNVAQQGVGYTFVHSVVDDHSRLAYSEALPTRKSQPWSHSPSGRWSSTGNTA